MILVTFQMQTSVFGRPEDDFKNQDYNNKNPYYFDPLDLIRPGRATSPGIFPPNYLGAFLGPNFASYKYCLESVAPGFEYICNNIGV
ncbi:8751_t:CDS:2 [Ambispora leptoticha]|uniref:8751_t:CDS:1 n=1 Tax=Ambispora leptoticha TaxID=144679 RepID=A0A9N9FZJ8_9GLOM|nr:8751_t:CDS:2 [Ambispora leptoticha]